MSLLITTIEIALLIMLPLVLIYRKKLSNWKRQILVIAVLYVTWYLTYAPLHELSHMLGAWIMGKEIFDYQLVPRFWKGHLGGDCYVKYDFHSNSKDILVIIMPYLRDIIFSIIGFTIISQKIIKQSLWSGMALIILVLSPVFDIVNNYAAYLLGSLNDFNALTISSTLFISNLIGVSFITFSSYLAVKVFILSYSKTN